CRNVMIYMGQVLQKRIVPLLHYAMNPSGILFLGSSETIGGFSDLFVPIEKKHKIYVKKQLSVPRNFDFVPQFRPEEIPAERQQELPQRMAFKKIAHKFFWSAFFRQGGWLTTSSILFNLSVRPDAFSIRCPAMPV